MKGGKKMNSVIAYPQPPHIPWGDIIDAIDEWLND